LRFRFAAGEDLGGAFAVRGADLRFLRRSPAPDAAQQHGEPDCEQQQRPEPQ